MKLITRDSDYAIRALCHIAKNPEERFSVADLIDKLGIPRPFLRKILQILTIKGILRSYKGKGGGFELGLSAQKIFISSIMMIFQGDFKLTECFLKGELCPEIKSCELRKKLSDIEHNVAEALNSITIASLLR